MVEALNEAIHKFGPPDIMHTDQGSQFTSFAWTDQLRRSNVRISMPLVTLLRYALPVIDGKGVWRDSLMIQRLRGSLKYECVYLTPLIPP